jgi:outer membrane protein assembly factor BamD (BamD/ComL family)
LTTIHLQKLIFNKAYTEGRENNYPQMNTAYYSYYIYNLIIKFKGRILCILLGVLITTTGHTQDEKEIQIANEYLLKGDKKKALDFYHDLIKKDINIPFIHNNYLDVMLDQGLFEEAQNYLKKISKKDPENIQYQLDAGLVYVRSGNLTKADKYFKDLIEENKDNVQKVKLISEYLSSRTLNNYATQCLLTCREYLKNPYLFCLELAMLYRLQGQRDKMVQEYLNYVTQNAGNIQYVKNVMQALLTKPDELESLEKLLYERVQQQPDIEVYADLLIWVTMQQKNFNAAFIQARAYDKRYKKDGEKCMEVARVALDNDDYNNAGKIYRYIIREFSSGSNFQQAQLGLIRTREARIRNTFPVQTDSVNILIADYKKFIRQYPENNNALEASRNEALLFANYLDRKDSAIQILNKLIANPRTSFYLKSKAKLDLGDIYLTKGESWESTLLYSQVEKTQKENPLGYEAKLKNAKLSYFKGDFMLAQEHLDILKEATTREIANDAMDLSMLIKENIAFDSAGEALKDFSSIELSLFQNKTDEALKKIEMLKQGKNDSAAFSNQTILDDVYWLEANIRLKKGEFQKALELLQNIIEQYGNDILADDAYFLQGEIYERHLKDSARAMEIYREFLNKYPGSVYAAEARKRFRMLRGDFDQRNP